MQDFGASLCICCNFEDMYNIMISTSKEALLENFIPPAAESFLQKAYHFFYSFFTRILILQVFFNGIRVVKHIYVNNAFNINFGTTSNIFKYLSMFISLLPFMLYDHLYKIPDEVATILQAFHSFFLYKRKR